MNQEMKIAASGEIEIYEIVNGEKRHICTRKNAIQPIGLEIIARRFLDLLPSRIDTIKVYESAALLATETITNFTYVSLGGVKAQFGAVFSAGSFTGHFNKVKLETSGMGETFSEVTGLDVTKGATAILIQWTITFS